MIQFPAGYDSMYRVKRYQDYYQASYGVMMLSAGQFSPLSLFAAGEQGVWYDPSDFTTMFQDAAGTTAVTAVEQPVGLILDKSGRGNHASQSTTTARPVLSARVTLLTYSEQFNNAAWANNQMLAFGSGSVVDAATAPNGSLTADLIVPNTLNSNLKGFYYNTLVNTPAVFSIYVRPSGYTFFSFTATSGVGRATINLADGSSTVYSGSVTLSRSVEADGWYRVTFTVPAGSGYFIYFGPNSAQRDPVTAWSGNGTSGAYIWGADLRVANTGVGLPSYQRIAAATDYDTTGFPLYLRFDGTDDSLVTATINPGSVDKAQVFAGARNLSDASAGIVAELSASLTANSGAFYLVAGNNGTIGWTAAARGSATIAAGQAAAYAVSAPNTSVICATYNISADLNTIRVNTSAGTNGTADQGTGNFLPYPLYIGRRGGTTLPFKGQLYGLIARFSASNLSAVQIASAEAWLNQKTKAY